jgi:hypothetical protein
MSEHRLLRIVFAYVTVAMLALSWPAPLTLRASDCSVEIVSGVPEGIDAKIAKQLDARHVKLRMNDEYDLCEIWIARPWTTGGESKPVDDAPPIVYPLLPGSLVGVLHVSRACVDVRAQEIPPGYYTLRYAVQPTFVAHQDSHETRDFLLLVSPKVDTSPEPIRDADQLIAWSGEAVQALHPGFLPLVKPSDVGRETLLRRDDRDAEGWILLLNGKDENGTNMPLEVIVLHAASGE